VEDIQKYLPTCDFIAFDEEMSGIFMDGVSNSRADTANQRYTKMCPMKTMIERHDEMLGLDEKTAHKFCNEWYWSKRQETAVETAAIWKQRKSRLDNEKEFSISELQEQVKK